MPHLKSVRLTNVHFNNATQFYDDFRMEFGGKNSTYDLENGGGKSLLLLMLLQTVLPKSNLRKEKPVSFIFQGGKDRTSHVVTEWILDEGSMYKYLLTGFSARKKKGPAEGGAWETTDEEENVMSGDIDHLNWCVFYNDNKQMDIKLVPLIRQESGKRVYASFDDIRKFIQQTRQKGLPAESFDIIGEYQNYISGSNLLAAEWNIIKGINSGENSIESYFRQNSTSRKLIENLFVKIIEDLEASSKGNRNNDESLLLADTLIEIRSRLNEYLKLKGHMAEFEKVKEFYSEFQRRNEELLNALTEHERMKIQAAGIKNSISALLEKLEAEKNEKEKQIAHSTEGYRQGEILKIQHEAGCVQFKLNGFHRDYAGEEEEKSRLNEEREALQNRFFELMTLEGYGEYRETRSRLKEAKQRLEALSEDSDEQLCLYRNAGGRLKYLLDQDIRVYQEKIDSLNEAMKKREHNRESLQNQIINIAGKEGVSKEKTKQLEKTIQEHGTAIHAITGFFLNLGEMDAVVNPEAHSVKLEEILNNYKLQQQQVMEQIDAIENEIHSLDKELIGLSMEIKQKEQDRNRDKQWLQKYREELNIQTGLAAGYEKKDLTKYHDELELRFHRESICKAELEIETGRLRRKKQLSAERGYYVPNEEILSLIVQLSSKCEYIQAGIDWIAQAEQEEKNRLLQDMPFLPFAVLVDGKSFEKLKNGKIRIDFTSDYSIPIACIDIVRGSGTFSREGLYYYCGFSELILDQSVYGQYIEGIDARLNNIGKEIATCEERTAELNNHRQKLSSFLEIYPVQEVKETEERVELKSAEILDMQRRQINQEEKKKNLRNEKESLIKSGHELDGLISLCHEKLEKLQELMKTSEALKDNRRGLAAQEEEHRTLQQNSKKLQEEAGEIDAQTKQLREEQLALMLQQQKQKQERKPLESFETIPGQEKTDEVNAQFKALQDAVSGKAADENRLRDDINNYEGQLQKTRERITREYQGDLEELVRKEEAGERFAIPTEKAIMNAKEAVNLVVGRVREAENRINAISQRISTAKGELNQIVKGLSEEARMELPCYESEDRYREEIQSILQLIQSYREEIKKLNDALEKNSKDHQNRVSQMEHYDSFLLREGIGNNGSNHAEIIEFKAFESEYLKLSRTVRSLCDKWMNRIKSVQEETVSFVSQEPIEELSGITPPEAAGQCLSRREAFREYLLNIDEQMQKISHDIAQLESYQQDFTRRCVQRAELVLGHLRKLEPLSRIEVYGRRTNMVEVKLQEFEEKEKFLRMKSHIDNIVKEIRDDGVVDRKQVAARLSTKELLARIVDMDKAVVKLYKVESIPENSRVYRWEQAIGSEGQNNSLYFIFAACLLSFIRMLSIRNTSIRTKKVIIADNPFGSTSAVYLWDPMFEIMKQNDIQLIAPGHQIPREITSRFGVSYLLNQDILQDGRMRVVVKDVRVEEDEERMKYLDAEQLTLF